MGITFSLQGWIKNTTVKTLMDDSYNDVDVSGKTDLEIVEMLKSGKYFISLSEVAANSEENDVEFFDYEVSG